MRRRRCAGVIFTWRRSQGQSVIASTSPALTTSERLRARPCAHGGAWAEADSQRQRTGGGRHEKARQGQVGQQRSVAGKWGSYNGTVARDHDINIINACMYCICQIPRRTCCPGDGEAAATKVQAWAGNNGIASVDGASHINFDWQHLPARVRKKKTRKVCSLPIHRMRG